MHILSRLKETEDPWIAGKIKDEIAEFGNGGCASSYQVGSRTSDC